MMVEVAAAKVPKWATRESGDRLYVLFTDGLTSAGERYCQGLDIISSVKDLTDQGVKGVSHGLLDRAVALDQGRASDDMSVLALQVGQGDGRPRELEVRFPLG